MAEQQVSRRKFLRISGGAFAGALAGITIHPRRQGEATPETTMGTIVLAGGDSDVWAWERKVSGAITDLNCDTVTLNVGENSVTAVVTDGQFSATVPIAEGENLITASCAHDDQETISEALVYTGKLRDVPLAMIAISLDRERVVVDGSGSQPSDATQTPIASFTWTAQDGNPAPITLDEPAGTLEGEIEAQRLVLAAPDADGEYYVSLHVEDENGRSDNATTYFTVEDGVVVLDDWDTENVDWIENTVMYGVIPRNFGSAGFDSISERLDLLKDLGINALWLAPVNVSPPGDYGYAVVNYFEFDRRYGDKEEFRRMVEAAHERGIRVLMDFVPNHSSERHPYFLDALNHGQDSPYWDFYARDETGFYTYYFDWTHLPNLNYENPEVWRWMLEAMTYWVREFDIDGYRIDVAWGIRERRPEFWMEWRHALKRIKPDVLLLAEASARDEFYFTDGFDAAYDWTHQLGHWAWELVFEDDNLLTFNLNSALRNRRQGYHPDALVFRFLNNNDTGARFITKYGLGRTMVATTLLLTLPGIPCVYTGDEYGEAFSPYSDPAPLTWREQHEGLRDYHKTLITLRRTIPSLYSRYWTIVELEPHTQVYGYLRHLADNSQPLLVLLNFFDEAAEVSVEVPEGFAAFGEAAAYQDLITGATITAANGAFSMPPYSAMILAPRS